MFERLAFLAIATGIGIASSNNENDSSGDTGSGSEDTLSFKLDDIDGDTYRVSGLSNGSSDFNVHIPKPSFTFETPTFGNDPGRTLSGLSGEYSFKVDPLGGSEYRIKPLSNPFETSNPLPSFKVNVPSSSSLDISLPVLDSGDSYLEDAYSIRIHNQLHRSPHDDPTYWITNPYQRGDYDTD